MPSKNGLTPDDQKCFDLLEYQADKIMDEPVNVHFPLLVSDLVAEGTNPELVDQIDDRRAELELVTDDLVRLPDGGLAQLYYELRSITEDQVQEFTGMTLEQWRKERDN